MQAAKHEQNNEDRQDERSYERNRLDNGHALRLFEADLETNGDPTRSRKRPDGDATTNVVVSAHVAGNAEVFAQIASLHLPPGSIVADVTFGKGVFWQQIPADGRYVLHASDIQTGVDCRNLPYEDESHDCVVLDPPYMEGLFRRTVDHLAGAGAYAPFRENYSDGTETTDGPKYHEAVLDLYYRAGREAYRVLNEGGIFIVKCQDEVSANKQRLTHIEITNEYASYGFYAKDLFVVVRRNRPGVSRLLRQVHARKNHSYFMVFQKTAPGRSHQAAQKALERRVSGVATKY